MYRQQKGNHLQSYYKFLLVLRTSVLNSPDLKKYIHTEKMLCFHSDIKAYDGLHVLTRVIFGLSRHICASTNRR